MIRVIITETARNALIAEGAKGELETTGEGLYWVDISEDIWEALLHEMAGEWELTETSYEEAICLSNAIIRRVNKQVGTA